VPLESRNPLDFLAEACIVASVVAYNARAPN
jgi:hypothetical protein